jgi:Type III restriction enzyme, res subunit
MNANQQPKSANFSFLAKRYPDLERIGALCERYFSDDPIVALITLRQFGELLAQIVAARSGLLTDPREQQNELLRRLRIEANYPPNVLDLFHQIRLDGNAATHRRDGDHARALACLKMARQLGIWFYRTFDDRGFKSGPFQPPRPPADASAELAAELGRLKAERDAALTEAQRAKAIAAEAEAARLAAEKGAEGAAEERRLWEQLAAEAEAAKSQLANEVARLQAVATSKPLKDIMNALRHEEDVSRLGRGADQLAEQLMEWRVAAEASPAAEKQKVLQLAEVAAQAIDLDEADTRVLIDEQLRERGWDADSLNLRYSKGSRPVRGKALAIAEWPTTNGPADYALFVGTTCIALVEAKRKRKNVQAAIDQTGRYAQGFVAADGAEIAGGGPWQFHSGPTDEPSFRVPFLFATNGRPYLKQVETQSGIWFRDARNPTNLRRALTNWPTPGGLTAELNIDRQAAQERLASLPIEFGFPLRDYQKRAIHTVENALASDANRTMLMAMATGTGKTKLAIALLYRLLETRRFRRVCFVVDRHALGEQAANEFKTIVVDELKKAFARRYGEVDDASVAKITGSIDDPSKLIRSFRNDASPSVAVTVDLLTTGIDIPKIENLVFIRRVASRILYEQMLGRATRLCPEIGKETFRIFDAVGIYDALQSLTSMKPVVVNPKLTLTQLLEQFARVTDPAHRSQLRDEILVKLRRTLARLTPEAQEAYQNAAGEPVQTTANRLQHEPLDAMANWIKGKPGIGPILDWKPESGRSIPLPISEHPDKVLSVTTGYGTTSRPEDFLSSFEKFIKENVNRVAALQAVVQRPRELTRDHLSGLRD